MKFDISNQNLTTLEGIEFPIGITELNCSLNKLTSLQYYPSSVQILHCSYNQLTSLQYCPPNLEVLYCWNNRLTSLLDCPPNIQSVYYYDNPLDEEYQNKSIKEITQINKIKYF